MFEDVLPSVEQVDFYACDVGVSAAVRFENFPIFAQNVFHGLGKFVVARATRVPLFRRIFYSSFCASRLGDRVVSNVEGSAFVAEDDLNVVMEAFRVSV